MIKIIGGKFKKSNLLTPKNNVRPTSAMKREAIFSIIENYANKEKINLYYQKSFSCKITPLLENVLVFNPYSSFNSISISSISI